MGDLLSYQKHSDTSREAAENNTTAGAQRELCFKYIKNAHVEGATADEVKQHLLGRRAIHASSLIGPRFRELELKGRIVKTTVKRKTIAGRKANVYVTKEVFDMGGFSGDAVKDSSELQTLKEENERMKKALMNILLSKVVCLQGLVVFESGTEQILNHAKKGLNENG